MRVFGRCRRVPLWTADGGKQWDHHGCSRIQHIHPPFATLPCYELDRFRYGFCSWRAIRWCFRSNQLCAAGRAPVQVDTTAQLVPYRVLISGMW